MYHPLGGSERNQPEYASRLYELPQPELSKYQKNDIFRAIEPSGLPITDFQLGTYIGQGPPHIQIPVIRHQSTGSVFGIMTMRTYEYNLRYQIGPMETEEELFRVGGYRDANRTYLWEHVPSAIKSWAGGIKQEIAAAEEYERTPDLWDALYRARDYSDKYEGNFEDASFAARRERNHENTPFTRAEQARISDQLQEIKTYIKYTYRLSNQQMSRVEAKLDEVEEASHRIGRKDWIILLNGAVASLILSDLIPQQAAQHIFQLVIHGLGHLFGFGGPPPHLPPG